HTHTNAYTHTHTHTNAYTHTCAHICTDTHTHTHTHTHTQMHTHTHTQMFFSVGGLCHARLSSAWCCFLSKDEDALYVRVRVQSSEFRVQSSSICVENWTV